MSLSSNSTKSTRRKKNYFANNKITKKRKKEREGAGERTVGRQEPPPFGRHCCFGFCLSVELFQGHFFVITQFLFTAKNTTRRTGNCCCCWRKSTTTNCKKYVWSGCVCVLCLCVCVCKFGVRWCRLQRKQISLILLF